MPEQLRAAVTRRGILEAAAHVFDTKGYDAATISDVVQAAGCTKGALYFHFDSKMALAAAIIAEQDSRLDVPAGDNAVQQLIDGAFLFASSLRDDVLLRASIRLTVQAGTFDGKTAAAYRFWADAVHGLLKAAQAQGLLRNGRNLRSVAECITGCITGIQLTSEALNGRADLHRRLTVFWRIFLPTLMTPGLVESLRLTPPRARRTSPSTTEHLGVPGQISRGEVRRRPGRLPADC